MIKHFHIILICLILTVTIQAQVTTSGPMQGHTTETTASIWLMVKKDVSPLTFELVHEAEAVIHSEHFTQGKWTTYILNISGLSGDHHHLQITNGAQEQGFEFLSRTKTDEASFSFLMGSCLFKWGPFLPLAPSNGYKIFSAMAEQETDLMLWLGDNVYYLLGDDKNEARMFKENAKTRKKKSLGSFIQNKQHYAIWDDHDYGPNNSLGNYENKELSHDVFNQFWVNPTNAEAGNYFSFEYANSEFFMLDSRWFRTEPDADEPSLLGKEQLQWLIEGISNSEAQLKFVALGSQIINSKGQHHERFASFETEYNALLQVAADVGNVIFLSGDMHYSTVFINEDFGKPLYEFSCSPLSAFRYKIRKTSDEFDNPYHVPGTQFHAQNFGKVTVDGGQVNFEIFDRRGRPVSEYSIPTVGRTDRSEAGPATGTYLPKIHKHGETDLPYRILYPEGFDPTKQYPVVFFLHGSGERGNDNEKQLVHGSHLFLDSIDRYPAIVIYPQCAEDERWANNKIQDVFVDEFKGVALDPAKPSMAALEALMDSLLAAPFVDRDRIYLLGLSMGGVGAGQLLAKFPERFAAAIILAGIGPMEHAEALAQTPTSIYHGANDEVVFTAHGQAYFNAIDDGKGKHRLTIYPGVGHESWNLAFAEPDFLFWLFSHRNQRRP